MGEWTDNRKQMSAALRLIALMSIAAGTGCASSGAIPEPFPGGAPAAGASSAPVYATGGGYAVAGTALSLRGSPYRAGGTDPGGFDCSGFVNYVFARHGYAVPRNVGDLFRTGEQVALDAVRPGDLVFFDTGGSGASHVGIAIGGDQFVHAPSTKGVVRVDRVSAGYWAPRFVGARRVM
jgi:cell wall-associated NlpC family hydrolase